MLLLIKKILCIWQRLFSTEVFFYEIKSGQIQRTVRKGDAKSLTPCHHFHPSQSQSAISRAIITDSLPPHIASGRTQS